MKILTAIFIVIMLLLVFVTNGVIAQSPTPEPTVLGPGDIAIIGYNTTINNDEIAILLLKEISINTEIKITDFGWDRTKTTPGFKTNSGDGIFSWYAPGNLSKGKVIKIIHIFEDSSFLIKNGLNGDQIFILQGNHTSNPNLVYGLNVNYVSWQEEISPNEFTSDLPQQLVNNNFCYEFYNGKYIGTKNFPDANSARLAIMNPINWQGSDTATQDLTFTDFSIGTTAVDLENFSVIKKGSSIYLYFFLVFFGIIIFIIRLNKITQINKEKEISKISFFD